MVRLNLWKNQPVAKDDLLQNKNDTDTSLVHTENQVENILSGTPPIWKLTTQTTQGNVLSLDILDLSRVIDIYAESQAVEAFDAEMGQERKWNFQKMVGFFARSLQRMGRDAWIDAKKRKMIAEIKEGLENGTYSEAFLREHVSSGDKGIVNQAYLNHEEVEKEDSLPEEIQSCVDVWMTTSPESPERRERTQELKGVIEENYPAVTTDLSQLEASLLRLERAKISSEVDTIEAKLNILDIGRIEQGNGQRKEGVFVKMADSIASKVNNSKLPKWVKEKIAWGLRHPNTAAVLTALGTRTGVGIVAGATVATGLWWGFIAPIIAGSVAGGFFASVRARREMRDRTAQIDRRGAMGFQTGHEDADGESSHPGHQTHRSQHPAMDLYNKVLSFQDGSPESREEALAAGISYLVKHRVGREQGINMLQYDADKSVSRQHVEMIRLMNEVFPDLVASFNDGSLFAPENSSYESWLAKRLYIDISDLATETMENRVKEEWKYSRKQGIIFGTTAAVVGGTIGAAVHGLLSTTGGHFVGSTTPWTTVTHYPDNLQSYEHIRRGFWFDNKTPAPRFDHTELMIRTDKANGWNVSHMLGKTASTLHHGSHSIHASDFSGKNIQAVLTPVKWGPSFVLPIDAKGNIQIPASMQDAFAHRSFSTLEVGEVKISASGQMDLHPIATVVGKGNMIFEKITETIPGTDTTEWVSDDAPWRGIPWGANKYHELGKKTSKDPIGTLVSDTPSEPEEEDIADNEATPPESIPPTKPVASEELSNTDMAELVESGWDEDQRWEMTKEKEKIENLWNEIIKIRQTLEGRKDGTVILSDSDVANMENTLATLLTAYQVQRKEWNTRVQDMEKMPQKEGEKPTYQDRIHHLIDRNILATKNGKPLMMNWAGRTIVAIRTKNGGTIPFYRSSKGTSGKNPGGWYPCFGITDDKSWLIKGTLHGMSIGHGIQEIKALQNELNAQFDWDTAYDKDFFWNKSHHPLVQAGALDFDIASEEKKQTSSKPQSHDDGKAQAWIFEWIRRVTGASNTDTGKESSSNTDSDEHVMEQYHAAMRILGNFTPVNDEVIQNGWLRWHENDPRFLLKDNDHRVVLTHILNQVKNSGTKWARRAVNAFYARGGKIWISDKTSKSMNSTSAGNIAIGTALKSDDTHAALSRRLYEISWVKPVPDDVSIVLFHELGHQITLRQREEMNTPEMGALLKEVQALRDEQGVGITPLSSDAFYVWRANKKPDENGQFWEDMAELMSLYLMGREYVVRYLDDRITTKRSEKANISEGLRDRIMEVLDSAYRHYTRSVSR